MTISSGFGVAAGLCAIFASARYIFAIFRGTTQPHKITWWIFALTSLIITASYLSVGARATAWLPFTYTIDCFFIAILSMRYGQAFSLSLFNIACLVGALFGFCLWVKTGSAQIGLYSEIVVDAFGIAPTISQSMGCLSLRGQCGMVYYTICKFSESLRSGKFHIYSGSISHVCIPN